MFNIHTYNTEREQIYSLQYEDYESPYLSYNRETKLLKFNKDITNNLEFRYADANKNDLQNYLPLDHNYESYYIAIPKEVQYINVYKEDTGEFVRSECIVSNIKDEPLYKVGLMSDVHYNDNDKSDDDPDTRVDTDNGDAEYSEDLQNALATFADYDVDFVSCSGDITTDYRGHFRNYKRCVDKYAPNMTIYTSVGNHDTKPKDRAKEEWKTIDSINDKYGITRVDDREGTSFYFIKELENGKKDVYIYLNLAYGWYDDLDENATEADYDATDYGTHNPRPLRPDEFVYKSQDEEVQWDDYHLYEPTTLIWFANLLEEHKDDRCFIFTHIMFDGKAGSYHGDEGFYKYYETHVDCMRGDQGNFLLNLLNSYDNNYWFCGHSHYKWLWEKYDHTMNVTKSEGSWNIHIPSLSRPLPIEIFDYATAPQDSEGAIMEVYDDYVVIKGMVMKNSSAGALTQTIEDYPDSYMEDVTAEMFTIPSNSTATIEQLDDGYVQLNVTYDKAEIFLNNGFINEANFDNLIPVLRFDSISIFDNDGVELYETIKDDKTLGFRDNTTDVNKWDYYFESNHIYTMYPQGIMFKISSQCAYKEIEFHIRMKLRIGLIREGYINKFLPIAQFKLN